MDNNTSSSSKTVGIVIVVIIIVAGIWLMKRKPSDTGTLPAATTNTSDTGGNGEGIQASGTSNAAFDQDSASIDTQMQALGADNASADETVQ